MKSRREFLKSLFTVLAAGAAAPVELLAHAAGPTQATAEGASDDRSMTAELHGIKFQIPPWTGDNFRRGHAFRDKEVPQFPAQPERSVEFVIVGGGTAGLSAAYFLKDHDFVLLEQYDQLGGHARGSTFKGIEYSYGAAYIGSLDGLYGNLYADLGIKPQKLPSGDNNFLWHHKWWHGLKSKEQNELYRHFKRLTAETAGAVKLLPPVDSPQAMSAPALARMDGMLFADTLKGYSPEFIALLNGICKSNACATIDMLSAAAGYFIVQDLGSVNYVFKGGNAAITRALTQKTEAAGSNRLLSGCFVWNIQLNSSGASVYYTTANGEPHHIACKHVIVATPPMVAWRQIGNLDDAMRAQLMGFKYGSYLVANLLLNRQVFSGAYDNWVTPPYTFTDFIVAETPYQLDGTYKAKGTSVLTVYHPWQPGSAGRPILYQGDRMSLGSSIAKQIAELVDLSAAHLQEIVLTRWGHAMAVPQPNYYARLRKIMASYNGPYTLAHCSTQGIDCAESAIRAGRFAADRACTEAKKISLIAPSLPGSWQAAPLQT